MMKMAKIEKRKFKFIIYAVLVITLTISNIWFFMETQSLRNQVNELQTIKNNLQTQVDFLNDQVKGLNAQIINLSKPSWAYGKKRFIPIPPTAGDELISLSPPVGKKWLVLYGTINLATSFQVGNGNRVFMVFVEDVSWNRYFFNNAVVSQPPNASLNYVLSSLPNYDAGIAWILIGIPNNLILDGGFDWLRMIVWGGFASDIITGQIAVLEIDA